MKWGILGTGVIAHKFADTLLQMKAEGEELVAVASRSDESARAFAAAFGVSRAYGSYESMLNDPEVEVIYIATPNALHYEHSKLALAHGKHVLCEKPFTLNVEQAKDLYALAKRENRFIMEAFWIRFLPVLLAMRSAIAAGEIGKLTYVRSEYGFIPNAARKERKLVSELGGGALLDIGVYNLGFVHMAMEESPTRFDSVVHKSALGTDDFSTILLEYSDSRSAVVTTAIGMDLPRSASVFGSEGEIFLPDFQAAQTMEIRRYSGPSRTVSIPFDINGFEYEIRETSHCIQAGKTTSDVLREKDTLIVLETMDAVRWSWNMVFPGEGKN